MLCSVRLCVYNETEETWVLVTSAVTGAVITVILISFLVFIVLFKRLNNFIKYCIEDFYYRTDRRKKDQQPLSQTLQPKTETNAAYGVVSRREDPEYEVIGLSHLQHRN